MNLTEPDTIANGATETSGGTERDIYPYVLHDIDPRTLRTDGNSRAVGDIRETRPDLVASVAERGVDPVASIINVALAADGVPEVLVGFHRVAAAVAVRERETPALTVSVLVHAPGTSRADVLVAQGIENMHRQGYTPAEEAALYGQLALAGLDDDELIAQALTRPVERVRAGRAITTTPRTRTACEELPGTDLMDLLPLLEFADDEDDHAEMCDILHSTPRNFQWRANQLRIDRQRRAVYAEQTQCFTERGYTIITDEQDPPEGVVRLDDLCTGDDPTPLESAEHATCPGRAVTIEVDYWMKPEITEYCTDYTAHGHHSILEVKTTAARDQLRAAGVAIAEPDENVAAVVDLFLDDQAETTMTAEQHTSCPGHAACIETNLYTQAVEVVYVCTDPAAHGHIRRASPLRAGQDRGTAFRAAETRRAKVNNKLWREAKPARRAWLATYFAGWRTAKAADLPARVHHWLALAPIHAADVLADAAPAHRYTCTLLKLDEPDSHSREAHPLAVRLRTTSTSETQAILIRLAQIIGACEEHWDRAYTDKSADASWRRPSTDTCFYLELLRALGYPLAHIEQVILDPGLDTERWSHLAPTEAAADTGTAA